MESGERETYLSVSASIEIRLPTFSSKANKAKIQDPRFILPQRTRSKNLRKAFLLHSEGEPDRLRRSHASLKRIDRCIRLRNRPFGSVRRIRIHELHGNGTAFVR